MKKNQARKTSKIAGYPGTYDAMWDLIPESVKKSCNSVDLGLICDVLRYQYIYGFDKGFDEGKECGKFEVKDK